MGTKLSVLGFGKKPPPKKRVRKSGKVYDYTVGPARKRPKTSKSVRDARYITYLGQQGRSATMNDIDENKHPDPNKPVPKWQSKWETDMRPDPSKPKPVTLRAWKSMPLPTTAQASASNRATPVTKPSSRRSRRSRFSRKGIAGRLHSGRMPDVEEPERFDIASISSNIIDEFRMIYKSDIKTQSVLDLTSKRWQYDQRKHNKAWFLGPENQKNVPEPTVSFENMPKKTKPFTSMVNLVRPHARHHEERKVIKQETIIEEE